MADWGWGFNRGEVNDLVQDFLKTNSIDTSFIDSRPNKGWLHIFLQRNPKITPRKTEHLSNPRSHAEYPETIKIWFDLVKKTLKNTGINNLPSQIFSSDESGFITDPKEQIILAKRGASRVSQRIGGSGREQITVNCACSACGHVLPPYIIYKGKNLYMDWVKGGPDGAHISNRPRVLILDGHISPITSPLINLAKRNNVILLRIPAYLTNLLQPLDTLVFRPVKSKWQSLLIKYARIHNGPVSKKHFPGPIRNLYQSFFTMEQVKSGFKGTGIFSLNKDAIDTRLFNQFFQSPVKKPTFSTNHLTRSCSMPNL
ncbi:uncharacterized protein LOC136074166 [Hydra vulgaris]|uniref:Uncharacterized protein LOC136074166 n=1 Tax=Hydra vulgaris TaxID=6087 RepID=A0ABM4B178_HYDVU